MQKGLNTWQQDTLKDVQNDMVELRHTNIETMDECFDELISIFDQLDNILEIKEVDAWQKEIDDLQILLNELTREY